MSRLTTKPSSRGFVALAARAAIIAGLALSASVAARADDPAKILKAMSDYVGSQKTISATFDSDVEVITPDLQKIQLTSSGQLQLRRPDKIRFRRTGGYTDVELIYDGKNVTLFGNTTKSYVQQDMTGSTDHMIDQLQGKLGTAMQGTDLLLINSYDVMMADVIDGRHIGQGVVDGIECEHLAFRNSDTDWQIWIETGTRPNPRKYVITSKTVAGAPQYTLRIKDWKTDGAMGAAVFVFKPDTEVKKIVIESMRDFDEVPAGVPVGARNDDLIAKGSVAGCCSDGYGWRVVCQRKQLVGEWDCFQRGSVHRPSSHAYELCGCSPPDHSPCRRGRSGRCSCLRRIRGAGLRPSRRCLWPYRHAVLLKIDWGTGYKESALPVR